MFGLKENQVHMIIIALSVYLYRQIQKAKETKKKESGSVGSVGSVAEMYRYYLDQQTAVNIK